MSPPPLAACDAIGLSDKWVAPGNFAKSILESSAFSMPERGAAGDDCLMATVVVVVSIQLYTACSNRLTAVRFCSPICPLQLSISRDEHKSLKVTSISLVVHARFVHDGMPGASATPFNTLFQLSNYRLVAARQAAPTSKSVNPPNICQKLMEPGLHHDVDDVPAGSEFADQTLL